jgi:hypothetical protein
MVLKPMVVFTHGMLENKLKKGKSIIYLMKAVSFQMYMSFDVELMVKYKMGRGL